MDLLSTFFSPLPLHPPPREVSEVRAQFDADYAAMVKVWGRGDVVALDDVRALLHRAVALLP